MNKITIFISLFLSLLSLTANAITKKYQRPRVIVMTDGEVDDRSSMVRFLLYANELDIEAIIQSSSVFQQHGWSSEKWIETQLDAYEQVYPNLIIHDPDYPTADELRKKLFVGDEDHAHLVVDQNSQKRIPGQKPQIDPTDWSDTPGSDRIVEILLDKDPRKVYISAWGGGNTAAKAFQKLKAQYPKEYDRAISKVVMYNIWYQDGAGAYIETYHPGATMLLCHWFSGTWDYSAQSYSAGFVTDYLHNGKNPLGEFYTQSVISEGDSPSFLYNLGGGLRGWEDPTYGGWGGMFYKVPGFENVYRDTDKGSFLRWVEAANRDFEVRLRWCITPKREDANHHPIVTPVGEISRTVKAGEEVILEADIVDNDSLDIEGLWKKYGKIYEQQGFGKDKFTKIAELRFPKFDSHWWQFKEAGTYNGHVNIEFPYGNKISFVAPDVDKPETIHLILEAVDKGTPMLTSYARFIVTVVPDK